MRRYRWRLLLGGLFCICLTGSASGSAGLDRQEYTGDFVLYRDIPVNLSAGTPEHPRQVELQWLRIETGYSGGWRLTARVGWSPAAEATWRIRVELEDDKGAVLWPSGRPTTFTGKAQRSVSDALRYTELRLGMMDWTGRRNAAKIRVVLETAEDPIPCLSSDASARHELVLSTVDADTGKPIPDAGVALRLTYDMWEERAHTYLYGTDAQGQCRAIFTKAHIQKAFVSVRKRGYAAVSTEWNAPYTPFLDYVLPIDLPDHHVLELRPAQIMGGIVQDEAGKPIAGVEVNVCAVMAGVDYYYPDESAIAAQTDKDGRWRVDGVPIDSDSVSLRLAHAGYLSDTWARRFMTGEDLLALRDLKHTVTMTKGLSASGRVLDDQGQPVARAAVILVPIYGGEIEREIAHVLTDASGRFRFDGIPKPKDCENISTAALPGGLVVEASGYVPEVRRLAREPNLAPVEFHLKRPRNIVVRVMDEKGRPIRGAWVNGYTWPEGLQYLWPSGHTDEQGLFSLPRPLDSDSGVEVGKNGYLTGGQRLSPASGDEIEVTLKSAPRVRGLVIDAQTGKGIPSFDIAVVWRDPNHPHADNSHPFTDGWFDLVFRDKVWGRVQIKAVARSYRPALSEVMALNGMHTLEFKLEADPSFTLPDVPPSPSRAETSESHVIRGVVLDPNGEPDPDVTISMFSSLEWIPDTEGRFKLRWFSKVGERPQMKLVPLIFRDGQHNLAAIRNINVTEAEDLVVRLSPGVSVSGKITDDQDREIPNAGITLALRMDGTEWRLWENLVRPDSNGRYEIRGLLPGYGYRVTATSEGYSEENSRVPAARVPGNHVELDPMVLSLANLNVSGVVVDANDKPVPNARVSPRGHESKVTDALGRFTLRGICPGVILIEVSTTGRIPLFGSVRAVAGESEVKIMVRAWDSTRGYEQLSMTGGSLWPLEAFGLARDNPDDGQMVLLCFFDGHRPPLHNGLAIFARHVDELRQRGVTTIAVQVGNVKDDASIQWLKEQSPDLLVGSVREKVSYMLSTWHIEDLPWLILTDRKHIVRAEGFDIKELFDFAGFGR
jgi:protocatechuate 3,4-dioxygenase beta subunit